MSDCLTMAQVALKPSSSSRPASNSKDLTTIIIVCNMSAQQAEQSALVAQEQAMQQH